MYRMLSRLHMGGLPLLLVAMCGVSEAASLRSRMVQAEALLEAGGPQEAFAAYQTLRTDYPGEDAVLFGAACAQYALAAERAARGIEDEARQAYRAAGDRFGRVAASADGRLGMVAAFNRANAIAQVAKLTAEMAGPAQGVPALRKAEQTFEAFLDQWPDYADAQQNLDHVRYVLKRLLQETKEEDTPPQGQPSQEGKGGFDDATTPLPDAWTEIDVRGDLVTLTAPGAGEGGP